MGTHGRNGFVIGVSLGLVLAASSAPGQTLTNASFETGTTDGWETFGPGWRVSAWSNETVADAHSGVFGAVDDVKEGEKEEWRGISQLVPAKHGQLYSGAVWVRSVDASEAECFLEFQFLDGDKKVLEHKQSDPVKDAATFTRLEIAEIDPPKGTRTLIVRGVVHMTKPPDKTVDVFVFDDFELTVADKKSKSNGKKMMTPEERIRSRTRLKI